MTTLPKNVEHFDRHGFAVFTGGAGPHSERDHAYNRSETHDAPYLAAWQKLLDSWDEHDSIGSTKLETFVKQGIPAELRPAVWKSLLEMESLKSTSKFEYQVEIHAVREQLIDLGISEYSGIKAMNGLSDAEMDTYEVKFGQISMDSLRHILLDLDRTYPTHRKYMGQTGEAKEGKAALFRILAAYARYNPIVGYCQGMSSIAGLFLMYLPEEDAFWCFVSLLERHKYLLGYYNHHMQRIQKHARVFEQLLTQRYPRLQSHLEALGVCALMFIPPWFISLYTSLPCWDSVLAIWDLLLLHGNKTMFRVALAIMSLIESDLLQADELGTLLPQILHPLPARINYSRLVHTIWSLSMEDWEITSLMAVLEEEEVKELGRRRAKEEVKEPDSMKRSSKRKRIDSSEDPTVKSWLSKVFSAFSGPPSMDDTNSGSLFHRAAKRQKSPTIDPKPTTRSSAFTRSSGCFVQHSKGSSAISSQQLKALHHDPCSGSRRRSWSSLVTSDQRSTGATRRSTQVTAQYLKRRLERKSERKSGHKTVLIDHRRRLHVSPCKEVKENSAVRPTLCAASQARQHNMLLHCNSFRQASVQHSFKAFHTPKPLRVTQRASSQTVPASHTLLSPEVELQSVRARKSYSAQS